jgi:long-chain acyl-CoA synthetase
MSGLQVGIGQHGEILVRGPNVTKGYWNKPGATAEAIKEGWLHTGDLGYLDDEGYLVLTGRKSGLILTAGGRNVAPQMVERLLRRDALIADAVVQADERGDLCALIVPAFEELEAVARSRGIAFTTRTDLVAHPAVQHLYETHLDGALSDLAPFEQVRRFAILDHDFAHQAGHLVSGQKPSRQEIFRRYAALLDAALAPR